MDSRGRERESRAGTVLEIDSPVTTVYEKPKERVLFDYNRDANPFFHFMEGLWMLAGRRDIRWIEQYNARMAEYSDNGVHIHGAYGFRWRRHFGNDQLTDIIYILKNNVRDRRAVLCMWDPYEDLHYYVKQSRSREKCADLPCNDVVFFKVRESRLDMTVCCRSNDMIWGCYGANAVHMSMLQEYLAAMIDVEVGQYWQISDSFHVYKNVWEPLKEKGFPELLRAENHYNTVEPFDMVQISQRWDEELYNFIEERLIGHVFVNNFFTEVAVPIRTAWQHHKKRDYKSALENVSNIAASDWRLACGVWLRRRADNWETKHAEHV